MASEMVERMAQRLAEKYDPEVPWRAKDCDAGFWIEMAETAIEELPKEYRLLLLLACLLPVLLMFVLGYGLAAVTKPFFALAPATAWVFGARFADRIGKGIRGAPRDALLADMTAPGIRGAAFGLRQALDTVGAFAGPLLAIALLHGLVLHTQILARAHHHVESTTRAFELVLERGRLTRRGEVADLALEAAGKVVRESMSGERQRRLVQEFLASDGARPS
mgnify:CR=1 FL=1